MARHRADDGADSAEETFATSLDEGQATRGGLAIAVDLTSQNVQGVPGRVGVVELSLARRRPKPVKEDPVEVRAEELGEAGEHVWSEVWFRARECLGEYLPSFAEGWQLSGVGLYLCLNHGRAKVPEEEPMI